MPTLLQISGHATMSQPQWLIKILLVFWGALESAAVTSSFVQASFSFITWRIPKKQMDATQLQLQQLNYTTVHRKEEEEVVCLRWQGWLKVLNPPGPLTLALHTPTTTRRTDCPRRLYSKYWLSHSTPPPCSQGTLAGRGAWSVGSSWEAVVAKVWLNQLGPGHGPSRHLRMADWQQAHFLHRAHRKN